MATTNPRFCTNCGNQIDLDGHFCAYCGVKTNYSHKENWASEDQFKDAKLVSEDENLNASIEANKRTALNFYIPGLLFFGAAVALLIYAITFNNPLNEASQPSSQSSEATVAATESTESKNLALEIVATNTQRQDSCYSTRTFNGDDPENARAICLARYPNTLAWAMSTNHNEEQSCYETRVFNGDDPVNARMTCLSRFPIR